jgi:hypothetical protein
MTPVQPNDRTAEAAAGTGRDRARSGVPAPAAAYESTTPAQPEPTDLFVWFEDTSLRPLHDGSGIAGLPESLLPWPTGGQPGMRVIERRYAEGHAHLLAAVRLRCQGSLAERIASVYTAALSVGTIAWIGAGTHYEHAWDESAS